MNIDKKIKNTKTSEGVCLSDMPALRQSFAIASILIIIGITLALLVHVYFIALAAMVAGGLMFSSIAGFCPMAIILQKMPWNK